MTVTTPDATPEQHLDGLVGYRFEYSYANGWKYELYVKNDHTIDYRIHSGLVGGRWVKEQKVDLCALDDGIYKLSWNEPTGTSVAVEMLPARRLVHGTIFFPRWVIENPRATVVFQNEHLDRMRELRDAGPTYPIEVICNFATITLMEYVGVDDETVISSPPPVPA